MTAHSALYFNDLNNLPTYHDGLRLEYGYHLDNLVYMIGEERDDERYYFSHYVYDLSAGEFVSVPKVDLYSGTSTVPAAVFANAVRETLDLVG